MDRTIIPSAAEDRDYSPESNKNRRDRSLTPGSISAIKVNAKGGPRGKTARIGPQAWIGDEGNRKRLPAASQLGWESSIKGKGMKARIGLIVGLSAVAAAATIAKAGPVTFKEMHSGSVSFTSDLENDKKVAIPKFDNMGGLRTLLSVTVEVCHSGQVDLAGDNDDEFQGATVRGRMIRQYSLLGGGVASFGGNTVNTAFVDLDPDDGDGGDNDTFDPTPPDGHDFGTVSYAPLTDGPFSPALGLYDSNGPGLVSYMVSPLLMVNDLQFVVNPDAWQLEVENPLMTVEVKVSYTYIPEPATAGLLAIGGLGILRLRRRR